MIYYSDAHCVIRDMQESDSAYFAAEEVAQGWVNATADKYIMRLTHARQGKCISLVAVLDGAAAGYVNVYPDCQWGAFGGMGYCEIVDFGVLAKYRNRGIGNKLMDVAEQIAFTYTDKVYLGVGLHSGYGAAQRLYIKRGYIPDGSGVWYGERVCEPYTDCRNDDGLILYLIKEKAYNEST